MKGQLVENFANGNMFNGVYNLTDTVNVLLTDEYATHDEQNVKTDYWKSFVFMRLLGVAKHTVKQYTARCCKHVLSTTGTADRWRVKSTNGVQHCYSS